MNSEMEHITRAVTVHAREKDLKLVAESDIPWTQNNEQSLGQLNCNYNNPS